MNWITKRDVDACKTQEDALECTKLHWTQILTASKGELLQYSYENAVMSARLCALCMIHEGVCHDCALAQSKNNCCNNNSDYKRASAALESITRGEITIEEFRSECQPMLDAIESIT